MAFLKRSLTDFTLSRKVSQMIDIYVLPHIGVRLWVWGEMIYPVSVSSFVNQYSDWVKPVFSRVFDTTLKKIRKR